MAQFKYSFSALVYYGEDIGPGIERVARFGYDAIEIPGEVSRYDPAAVAKQCRNAGIAISSICAQYTPQRDFAHPDASVRKEAARYVEEVLNWAHDAGTKTLIIAPTSWARPQPPANPAEERKWALDGINRACEQAGALGIDLTLECWNRYETYFLNRLEQALAFMKDLNQRNIGVMGDTFHMNIEEESIPDAFRQAGKHLNHLHMADSNRAAPGKGHIDFVPILRALADLQYEGYVTFEILPASADPFGVLARGEAPEFYDPYTELAISTLRGLESQV
jgi:sugar phosphate isomerase/epimerase